MRRFATLLYAPAVAAALAFGASQAVASPREPAAGPKCDPTWCDRICRAIGAFSGTCIEGGGCACALGGE
ncbi:MAG TPA: hypothetical protein VHG91_02150 [Longimicrobium sp.]|nr:hypothetical protein [Longimicrobium sp.]